jgi:di/tricarboxylate transporter
MIAMLHFATLVIATMFAVAAAAAFNWLLLHATFRMMRPATAKRIPVRTALVRERNWRGHSRRSADREIVCTG